MRREGPAGPWRVSSIEEESSSVDTNISKVGAKMMVPDFSGVPSDRTRRNGLKLKRRGVHLNMKKLFPLRVAERWNRLPRVGVECPSGDTPNPPGHLPV